MPDTTKTPFAPAVPSRLVGAYVIDMLVLGVLLAATWLVYFTPLTITLITIEAVIAAGIMLGATGRTPGMAAMHVCLIRDDDDTPSPHCSRSRSSDPSRASRWPAMAAPG